MLSLWILLQLILIGIFQAGQAVYIDPGQSSPKIGEFPYMVEIFDKISFKGCGGAIIDPFHILTAAHCLAASLKDNLTIIAGAVDLYSKSRIEQHGVAEIFIHDEFAMDGTLWHQARGITKLNRIRKWFLDSLKCSTVENHILEYDIAVLKLNEALPIWNHIKSINLPSLDSSPECSFCSFAGWGQTEIDGPTSRHLYATQLVVLTPEDCAARFARVPFNEFCAMHPDARSTPLEGDSGAPLVLDNTVYGISSRSRCHPHYPAIFTKVTAHLEWIHQVLEKSVVFV